MITISAWASYGNGGKQFVARITGRDSKYTFDREFIGKRCGKRDESTEADVDEPGLYECRNIDRKGNADDNYYVILGGEDTLGKHTIDKSDAMKIAKRLDERESIDDICVIDDDDDVIVVSPAEARKRKAAATLDSAIDECWSIIQRLPEKEAKKVLTALRKKLAPPKPAKGEEGGD